MRALTVVGATVLVAFGLAACGSAGAPTAINQPAATPATDPATTPTTQPVAHVGATLDLSGQNGETLAVLISSIVDPATGAAGLGPQDGTRLVAVTMTITNSGAAAVTGDVDNDASVIGSDGQTYRASFFPVTGCTNFNSGQYQLAPSEAAAGCATYQLPPGVSAAKVKYSPDSGFAAQFGEWVVP